MVRDDLLPFSGPLLAAFGFAFQWARANSRMSDKWTGAYAVALALAAYLLCFDFTKAIDVQWSIIQAVLYVAGNTATVLGGTFSASSAAKAGVPVIPMTNSK